MCVLLRLARRAVITNIGRGFHPDGIEENRSTLEIEPRLIQTGRPGAEQDRAPSKTRARGNGGGLNSTALFTA